MPNSRESNVPKKTGQKKPASVLLLTASPPGSFGVGQLFLQSQCSLVAFDISVAALLSRGEDYTLPSNLRDCPNICLTRRYEPAIRPFDNLLGDLFAAAVRRIAAAVMPHSQSVWACLCFP